MRTNLFFNLLFLGIVLLSCSDRLETFRQIDGTWLIEKVEYGNANFKVDSVSRPIGVQLTFDRCGSQNSRKVNSCPLLYNRESFRYRVTEDDGQGNVGLEIDLKDAPAKSPSYLSVSRQIFGNHTVESISGKTLILLNKKVDLQNNLPFRWQRITARRSE